MGAWRWLLRDARGEDMRATGTFTAKNEAEAWMGEHWNELLDEGATSVTLMEDDRREYDMGLTAE